MADLSFRTEPVGLTPLERGVMRHILEGPDPDRDILRRQVASATVVRREYTGVGFFTHFSVDSQAPRIRGAERLTLGENVGAQFPTLKHGAGFILFVDQGAVNF